MSGLEESPSKTFCIYPWTHLATLTNGAIIPCCVAADDQTMSLHSAGFSESWNSKKMKSVRKQMLAGQRVEVCQRCYIEEDSGIDSHRVQSNQHYLKANGSFEPLLSATEPDGFLKIGVQSLDLRLGNNCNLKCVMCRPAESSKWLSHAKKMQELVKDPELKHELSWKTKIKKEDFEWCKKPSFWDSMGQILPDMREVIIGGGEPFLSEEQNRFLTQCVESGHSKHLKIRYHTNGTILPEAVVAVFPHFKEIQLMVSLDGVAEKNHYMRYPADWAAITRNLARLEETPPNVTVFLLTSVHMMSLFYLPEFVDWKLSQNFKKVAINQFYGNLFNTGLVHDPAHLNIRVFSKDTKRFVNEKFKKMYRDIQPMYVGQEQMLENNISRLNGLLEYMDAEDWNHLQPRFKEFITAMDTSRGTSFPAVFPELAAHMGW